MHSLRVRQREGLGDHAADGNADNVYSPDTYRPDDLGKRLGRYVERPVGRRAWRAPIAGQVIGDEIVRPMQCLDLLAPIGEVHPDRVDEDGRHAAARARSNHVDVSGRLQDRHRVGLQCSWAQLSACASSSIWRMAVKRATIM